MRVAVDVDGVLINLMAEFLRIYNKIYKDNKQISDVKQWSFYEDFGISREECFDIFHKINLMDVPVIEPNIAPYLNIINKKHHVDIVTARRETDREILIKKLESMGVYKGKQYNELVIVGYEPHTAKADLDYDVYVDDSPELAKAIIESNTQRIMLLFDQPWNHSMEAIKSGAARRFSDGIRAYDWKDTTQWLQTIPCKWGN